MSEAVQAEQLTAAVELAYCQPAVGGFFNFELRDDSALSGWQSGLLRPDWSAKPVVRRVSRGARGRTRRDDRLRGEVAFAAWSG